MNANTQTIHPSLLRYLPGHLPKRQRRLYTGKTNSKLFEPAHVSDVQNEVEQHLTMPNRLTQSLLPSPTVMRAATNGSNAAQTGIYRGAGYAQPSNHDSSVQSSVKDIHNDPAARTARETTMSLLASHDMGKDHTFTKETFYFGPSSVGGAGQLEYNDSADPYGHNPTVSAWNIQHHCSPTVWFAKATQHPQEETQQIPVTTTKSSHLRGRHPQEEKGLGGSLTSNKASSFQTKPSETTVSHDANSTYKKNATCLTWAETYVPPDVYDVPPPKLRFELTDYHPTFNVTAGAKNSSLYTPEKERLQSVQHVPLPTPTNITLYKPGRRRYPQ